MEKLTTIQISTDTKSLITKLKGLFMASSGEKTTVDQVIHEIAKQKLAELSSSEPKK
jgi:hypothetical protein